MLRPVTVRGWHNLRSSDLFVTGVIVLHGLPIATVAGLNWFEQPALPRAVDQHPRHLDPFATVWAEQPSLANQDYDDCCWKNVLN